MIVGIVPQGIGYTSDVRLHSRKYGMSHAQEETVEEKPRRTQKNALGVLQDDPEYEKYKKN